MKKINVLLTGLLISSLIFTGCKKDVKTTEPGDYENGIFVVNETMTNSSISYLSEDYSAVENGIFNKVNGESLGDQAQSITLNGDNAYIMVSNSNKIEVVDKNTMEKKVTIASQLIKPRYMAAVDGNIGFISCWGDTGDDNDDYVAILNTTNNSVISQLSVPLGPEKIIADDSYAYVAHKGAWGNNNIVSVIDLGSRQISNTIQVSDKPESMVLENHFLWVLCTGTAWGTETAGALYKIDIDNNFSIVQQFQFAVTQHPQNLSYDNGKLYYYLDNQVFKMDSNDTSLPSNVFIDNVPAYNMSAKDGKLYVTDAKNYTSEGDIIIYDLSTATEITRKTLGIIPGDISFNF